MKLSVRNILMVLFVSCLVYLPIASAEGVPTTFSSGTTAKSSEVNDNFNFVNYGNIVVKANGVEVGSFLSITSFEDIDLYGTSTYHGPVSVAGK